MVSSISVIVPVKDEEENVRKLTEEIFCELNKLSSQFQIIFEAIFVDDKSHDNTLSVLRELLKEFPELRVFAHEKNCGQSSAIRTGMLNAKNEYIIILDGDGQNDPQDISVLIREIENKPDLGMIIGHRKKRQDNGLRKISSLVANKIRAYLLHDETPDSGCGLKILRRDLFLNLPFFNHMHRFMPALVCREGLEVLSIEVNHRERLRGNSKYGFWGRLFAGIIDLLGVSWLIHRMKKTNITEINKN